MFSMIRSHSLSRGRAIPTIAAALAAALVAILAAPSLAGGQDAEQIGKTKETPKPSCPKDPCQAIGSVTGFQVSAGGQKDLMAAPGNGHLVAWSVDLSKPKSSQRKFFGKFYKEGGLGTVPAARIAVLKSKQKAASFTLKAQSPVVDLSDELGSKPIFTLADPIPIRKGDILAITVPTWIPNFAVDLANDNAWRASRERDKCENPDDIKDGKPHEKVGKSRSYGCLYRQARVLYKGFYVPGGGS
jgi:hypothetical protein